MEKPEGNRRRRDKILYIQFLVFRGTEGDIKFDLETMNKILEKVWHQKLDQSLYRISPFSTCRPILYVGKFYLKYHFLFLFFSLSLNILLYRIHDAKASLLAGIRGSAKICRISHVSCFVAKFLHLRVCLGQPSDFRLFFLIPSDDRQPAQLGGYNMKVKPVGFK